MGNLFNPPKPPAQQKMPSPADPSDEAIRKAKLMERRRQLGLDGAQSTWLTGARGDTTTPTTTNNVGYKTFLGG